MRAVPVELQTSVIFLSHSAPSLLSSLNPAERMMIALQAFLLQRVSTVARHIFAGMARMAQSTEGSSSMSL